MACVDLPKDAEGREIPLDTVALYDDDGNVHSIRRFIYTNDSDLNEKWINSWIAVADDYKFAKNYWEELADLIDRPTCRNIADLEKESFRCSRCGCRVLATGSTPDGVLVVTSEAFPVNWYSCPVCGAEVIDDD